MVMWLGTGLVFKRWRFLFQPKTLILIYLQVRNLTWLRMFASEWLYLCDWIGTNCNTDTQECTPSFHQTTDFWSILIAANVWVTCVELSTNLILFSSFIYKYSQYRHHVPFVSPNCLQSFHFPTLQRCLLMKRTWS